MIDQDRLSHAPIRPPRHSRTAEHVYAAHWSAFMLARPQDDERMPLAAILYQVVEEPTQRHASIAASFICWLGTALGLAWKMEADRYAGTLNLPKDWSYLAAWSVHNRRDHGGGGFRTIEHILAPEDYFGTHLGHNQLLRCPDLSPEDYEVVDCVVRWLGRERGQAFLRDCEDELREIQSIARWVEREQISRLGPGAGA